jgi:hypothetical protein
MKISLLSKELDSFILDKDETIWVAKLSNGSAVYQDDNRINVVPASAWFRLKDCVEGKSDDMGQVSIVGLSLRFRDHIINLPDNKLGYYFSKGIKARPEVSKRHYVAGYLDDDGKWYVTWYMVPELLSTETNVLEQHEVKDKFIIQNG